MHLAKHLGCRVVGVTLEAAGADAGRALAHEHGVSALVEFRQGDLLDVALEDVGFDAVLMECVLSILSDKPAALARLTAALKPGGTLVVTDVTVSGELPADLRGVLAVAGCVGDARPLDDYRALLTDAGLELRHAQHEPGVVSAMLQQVRGRLLMADVARGLGKLAVDASLIARGRELLDRVQTLVDQGTLGYAVLAAGKR